ncbi:MAG: glycine betaine/L-proline ABC transporter substrate-binding protein ProX [Rhodocyclaceae bacterium]|nr:glycine betaine/L-proline ABC transporter substrate-binding protein ProX [Zoogloeaceae bacterium]MCP5241462.1 glycine betaine/L-proline ABC transporter substrate-binding protein ProX [Zoogloeaceae bacterium]MCP5252957.1 glycine betaine/L-proline ABC transporter substrate-binding protein ProX [Zoogloeaceae bacterium]MCP5293223.1 glycine betaine/L-proline ABC transporter substrate-binding protein ProX [Zoogloeaceae bacterium]
MKRTFLKTMFGGMAIALCSTLSLTASAATDMPGKGVTVQPIKSSIAEETFQTELVMQALKDLGYTVQPIKEIEYAAGHIALGNGDATFMADHWNPLHVDFYEKAGGDAKLYREGVYSEGALQGYLIDKKTAEKYGIKSVDQLKDPKLAKLFDSDGDGKADLAGCNPGWGCEKVIEHHLDAYGLRDTVTHRQGSYAAIIADTIARYKQGQPIFYYTWTPYWVSGVLVPNKDVVWLQVPFSSLPGERKDVDTSLPDGSNYGFQANNQHIVANRAWVEANPAAGKLFAEMKLSNNDISAQNKRMRDGENKPADIERHVAGWIKAHRATYDGWLKAAREAAK